MVLKLYVMGVRNYSRDTMCMFDGLIVATSILDMLKLDQKGGDEEEGGGTNIWGIFRVIKIGRVVKALKVFRTFKFLRSLEYL